MIGVVLVASTILLAAFFLYVYRQKRQSYVLAWSTAWLLLSAHLAVRFASTWLAPDRTLPWPLGVDEWLQALAALGFYCSARLYNGLRVPVRSLILASVMAAAWAAGHAHGDLAVPVLLGVGLCYLLVGQTFWTEGRRQEARSEVLLGLSFVVWGLLCFVVVFQSRITGLEASDLRPLIFLPQLFTCVLMVMSVYEEERRRVERNMVALSNLNLATSSFAGAEIQKMLAQALDRVLSVARIPAGALCMRPGDSTGPAWVIMTGLDEEFCASIHEGALDGYVVNLVARLGGLVVLRDLARDANWEALEKEEPFRRLRQLLVGHGLRTVVGISLQSKDRVFGMLMLGTPDARHFSPAELRLLLALGHQIGMAVENSYLVQQSARRTDELNILNEIGRALSSTLDLDTLLDRIYAEMRRVFAEEDFFIAFCDEKAGQVRFELEATGGQRGPKRTRPMGNHLVEYVVRTAKPLLIREHFEEETRELGFEPRRKAGSLCAVPLILYDRPVGVMLLHSARERAFDEGQVEMLRVLASEAAIAIENARLFAEEQKKSRQLTLINNVSRHAITTLEHVAMLGKIAAEMEKQLPYEHIGIALLDESRKEVVVQAEAGTRREAMGRHIPLGEGLVGKVARTGQPAVVRDATIEDARLVLPGSAASIAVPIRYSDHLLGVLYVESSAACDFPEADEALLSTLADLFSGALHNAQNYQKAQEQAITDGLTGVKTHRYLMESLSQEWKRSTRANRPFALMLLDLDRFKFVNDFYGHLEGDVVLQRVGHILEQHCRRSDIVARYGGDEFVLLMPEATVEQARQLAHKLRGWVASDPLLREKKVTASFGIAGFPVHGSTPQELIQVADSSMYLSKHQGGNSVSTAGQADSEDRRMWKKDVLEAYLGVTLKRLFSTGPEAFEEIRQRLDQFTRSLADQNGEADGEDLPAVVVETVTSLAFAVDAKDHYTQGHSQKVSAYAVLIARALGMNPSDIEEIRLAALLHDVGKVGIPETILNKSGPLDASEWEIMKTHTELGDQLLEPLKAMARVREMIRHHHEFYDGSGYPARLEGERIPQGARVIAIADAYDTITTARSYKKARPAEDALAELERCAANQFDPQLVRVFVETMRNANAPLSESSAGMPQTTERVEI